MSQKISLSVHTFLSLKVHFRDIIFKLTVQIPKDAKIVKFIGVKTLKNTPVNQNQGQT